MKAVVISIFTVRIDVEDTAVRKDGSISYMSIVKIRCFDFDEFSKEEVTMSDAKQYVIEFTEKKPQLDIWYRGHITKFFIKEQDMDQVLKIRVKVFELDRVFTYSVYISNSECSRFYDFATDMQLIRDDGRADLRRLNYDCDVWVEFVDTQQGRFIGAIFWAVDDEEEE